MTLLQLYTLFHTALSLVALIAGLLVVKGLIFSQGRQLWTLLFLCTAAATTVTGFFFPFQGVTPALVLGVISIAPITLAFVARYRYRLAGAWRGTYVVCVVLTLYLNCVGLVGPAFQIAQLLTLIAFIVAGVFSFKNYRPKSRLGAVPPSYVSPHHELE